MLPLVTDTAWLLPSWPALTQNMCHTATHDESKLSVNCHKRCSNVLDVMKEIIFDKTRSYGLVFYPHKASRGKILTLLFLFQYVWYGWERIHRVVRDGQVGQVNIPDDEPDQRTQSAFKPGGEGEDHLQGDGQGLWWEGVQAGVHQHLYCRSWNFESPNTTWNVSITVCIIYTCTC